MPRQMRYSARESDCVILTALESEFSFLKSTLLFAGFRAHRAETLEELDFLLIATGAKVLLSDTLTPTCTWRCAAGLIAGRHPYVAMLLIAEPVDAAYLTDAYARGVCGVIWKPIEFDAATDLIRAAHQAARDRILIRHGSELIPHVPGK